MYSDTAVKRRHNGPAESRETEGFDNLNDDYKGPAPVHNSGPPSQTAYAYNPLKHQQQYAQQRGYPAQRPRTVYSSNKYIAFYQRNDTIILPMALTILAFWTRFRKISDSNIVVWDEAHFGKFGSQYLKQEFYFDVHPPLGKMLVGLSGLLAGYDGSYEFKSGDVYPANVNYTFMRLFNAFFGAVMVPLAYFTAEELRMSKTACAFAATMVLLDNAYLTISRFILLDSMLLASTCFVLFCMTKFRNERHDAFSLDWWLWLVLTGVSIGIVSSVKWVGLFVTALVGLHTVEELWELFGDLSIPKTTYLKHWIARAVCLIMVPFAIYACTFAIHFAILSKSGSGDAQMSSLFQAGLHGNEFHSNPLEVAFGSKVTIKNTGYGGGLLHSHVQTYPEGSNQQQVTCYHHKDSNNQWFVQPVRGEVTANDTDIKFLKNGDTIRLVHEQTKRNLHSHAVKAPMTTSQWEVSGYGSPEIGDSNDDWVVEVVSEISRHPKNDRIRSLTTNFRLRHSMLDCYLTAENVNLPQWGFKQIEVYCDKRKRSTAHSVWNVEQHWNDKLEPGTAGQYRSSFWADFWHLNVAMMTSNNALVPDPDKEDILASAPGQWPLLAVGLRMCGWGDETIKFYLLGNPIVWWGSFLSLGVFVAAAGFYIVRQQRRYQDITPAEWDQFQYAGKALFAGWFLHYIPFCIMGRVTYLHHYFPALYFSLLLAALMVDHGVAKVSSAKTRALIWSIAFGAVLVTFLWFAPVSYGLHGSANQTMKGRQWRAGWNIIDDHTPGSFM